MAEDKKTFKQLFLPFAKESQKCDPTLSSDKAVVFREQVETATKGSAENWLASFTPHDVGLHGISVPSPFKMSTRAVQVNELR